MGAGRTELFECLMGMRPTGAGELRLNGKPITGQTVAERIAQGLMLLPEDRHQQKVVVAKALLTAPKVLLLDEPTRGIDVGAKAEMFEIMRRLARAGLGVIFSSSELMEMLALADRILVMSKGKITGEFDRAEATEAALVVASGVGHGARHKEDSYARN